MGLDHINRVPEHLGRWRRRAMGAIAAAAALAACVTAPPPQDAASDPDPWALTIAAERYGVLIDRAFEGAVEGPPALTAPEEGDDEDLRLRARAALHANVLGLYRLRALTCGSGLTGGDACGPAPAPDWLGEPHDAVVSWVEIDRRTQWLAAAAAPFIAAGCDAGDSRITDHGAPRFCSVE